MNSPKHPGPWKCGREFLPYHPAASHVDPSYRDGWNHCYTAAQESCAARARELLNALPFTIDGQQETIRVLHDRPGPGCRPASSEECALWDALQACLPAAT